MPVEDLEAAARLRDGYLQHPDEAITVAILDARLSQFELRLIRELKPNWVKHVWQSVPVLAILAGAVYSLLFSPIQAELAADHVHLVAHDVNIGDLKTQQLRNMDNIATLGHTLEEYATASRGRADDTIDRLNRNSQGVSDLKEKVGEIQTQQSQTAGQLNDLRTKVDNIPKPVIVPATRSRRGKADDVPAPGESAHQPVAVLSRPEHTSLKPLIGVQY